MSDSITNKAHFQYYNTGLSVPSIVIENSWRFSTEISKTGDQWDRRHSGRYVQCVSGSKFVVLCYDNLIMLIHVVYSYVL